MKQLIARSLLVLLLLPGGFLVTSSLGAAELIPLGAEWKYLDDGSDQGTAWLAPGFDDSAWPSGPAQFGYGDGDEATILNFGPDPNNKFITSYFRHTFNVADPGDFSVGLLQIRRDDGVILYLNGIEIFRDGFSLGDVTFLTLAVNAGDDGQTLLAANFPVDLLVAGENVLAAEVHQSGGTSSDVSFELELAASAGNPTVSLTSPGNGATFTTPATIGLAATASDPDGTVAVVEFFQGATKLGEDASSPFSFDWAGVTVGNYSLRAVATDDVGMKGTSAVVNVTVLLGSVPTVASRQPAPGNIAALSTITVVFSEGVSGVNASDLFVNGVPATSVTGSGSNYQFTVVRPAEGTVYVAWNGGHGISDFESPPKAFDNFGPGATWQYTLTDTTAPTIVELSPTAGATVNELDGVEVTFSEPVAGIEPADLRINGVAATGVNGTGAGPYHFSFPQPANGAVTLSWLAGHGIRDLAAARNPFAGGSWGYTLNTNAVWEGQVVISEIMFHPPSELLTDEWIELRNRGAAPVNLAGWRLNRAIEFEFPNVTLPAGGHLVIAANIPAFTARYPGVTGVVGGWTGRLSNIRDEVELEDASGNQVDLVEYADQGEWAVRTLTGLGWDWSNPADGLGASLELRQVALPNDSGQNWLPSSVADGTPGQANSVATANLPPMILEVSHLPVVPHSTNSITFLARVLDESASGLTVRLRARDVSVLGEFSTTVMLDNGLSNDGVAGDGVYGAVLPPQSAGFIGEYYIEAIDAAGNPRTWPPVADVGGSPAQEANAFFQVDDEVYTGRQPLYRIIMRPNDRNTLIDGPATRYAHNVTFITIEGSDVQIRHNCTTRRRGASSFGARPPTMKFDVPRDRVWNNKSSINLNSVNTHAQVVGAAVALEAGLPAPLTTAVQLRFNGINESRTGSDMFGSYAAVEVANDEWARDHFPEDANGNVYSKRRPLCPPGLDYLGTDPQAYIACAYDKESNASENDWSDLVNLMFAFDPNTTPANNYVQAIRQNVNVDLWMRYFAVLFLLNYTETALANGENDDYDLYRGLVDRRFMILPHDFDSILGSGGSTADNLFLAAAIPNVSRFLHHPDFEPLFYAEYRRQLAGAFSTNNLFPLIDQVLGDWVTGNTIQSMKNNALGRIGYVQGAVPAAPASVRATIAGEPDSPTYLTTATLTVGGSDITHYRFRLNGGAWSADRLVSQPIDLTGLANGHYTVFVVGRNSGGIWQPDADATVSKTWAVLSSLRGVVINEVLARNDGAVNHEGTFPDIIELFNPVGGPSVDLSGYRLTDDLNDPNKFTFPAGTTLAAGAYRVLYGNNPDGTSGLHLGFGLNQDGDTLYLLDRATNGVRVIDSLTFGWQLANRSVGRLPNGQWGLCTPTAGAANTAATVGPTGTLKINEWLASPASPFVVDFIEVYNPNALPVNLGGLFLTDQPIGQPSRHRIAPLSFIDGFGYRAFVADGDAGAGSDHLDFSLAEEGGEIALVAGGGMIIDQVVYSTQFAGVSQGRSPNGGVRIVYFDQPTPGAGNPVAPGPVEPLVVSLVPLNDTFAWRYNDTGEDLGTAWRAPGYNDSAWPSGPGVLGFDSNLNFLEPLRTQLAVASPKVTYYFRAHFNLPAGLTVSGLRATHLTDDGAVFHLNGVEIGRFGLPSLPTVINSGTLATSHEANVFETTMLNPAQLGAGDNVIAVEVHQNATTSADLVFGLRLDALIITNNPVAAGLKINEVLANARNSTNTDGTITDWAELYNPSTSAVDLTGMSLTDQLSNPRRWVFPTGSVIAAGAYRIVRFDPDAPASTSFSALLNSGFGLKSGGDALYLFNRPQSGGDLLDSIAFGLQAPDFSIGRVPSGGTDWVLNVPSQGAVNIAAALGNRALLKVNEWMAAPASGPDWFELYNPSAQPVDLGGLHLTDDLANRLKYPPIPARSYIAAGLSGFQQMIADGDVTAGADHVPFALGRTGDDLGISDAYGTLIDSYRFGAQVTAVSQGRLPDGSTNIVFFVETPTPDESNYLPIPGVVINEVLTDSALPLEDAIELRNTSGVAVNISGWYMSDARTALRKFRIPINTTIAANGFMVFYENRFNPIPNDPGSFSLSSAKGDEVYLSATDAQGQLNGFRAKVDFGPAANAVSFGRYVTSALNGNKVEFVAMAQRTFGVDNPGDVGEFRTGTGRTNSGPRIGPVVISEVMYHPPDLVGGFDNFNDEYVELQNLTASPVSLFDPAASTNTWRLRDAVSFVFPRNTVISANGFILIVAFNPADTTALNAFKAKYNIQAGAIILGPYEGKLDNSSDSVELARPDSPITTGPDAGLVPYVLVDKVKYFDTAPWPIGADGGGQSLTRLTPGAYGNDPVNWSAAAPTPGPQGASTDNDGDGMPNTWETQYALNPNVNDAFLDLDGDGLRNLDEYLAGTAPNDPSSVLRVTIVPGVPVVLRFNAAANVAYIIEYKATLASGSWTTLQTAPAGAARQVQLSDPSPGATRFYRVRTQ